jgi:hypothetical protein
MEHGGDVKRNFHGSLFWEFGSRFPASGDAAQAASALRR